MMRVNYTVRIYVYFLMNASGNCNLLLGFTLLGPSMSDSLIVTWYPVKFCQLAKLSDVTKLRRDLVKV